MFDIEQLYNEYFMTVYKYLYSLCHNKFVAEELTQETFCRSIKTLDSFNGNCKVSVWLCQIAKYCWYEELKKEKQQIPLDENIQENEHESIEEKLIAADNKDLLYDKIEKLDEPTKKVIYYRISSNMSFRQIRINNGSNRKLGKNYIL